MSHLSSTLLGRGQIAVAIAGGTGNLGQHIAKAFLSPGFKPFFSRVVLPLRDASTSLAQNYAGLGAEVVAVDMADASALEAVLRGVDVVVNVLGSKASASKKALLEASVKCGVAVYFPSEFGCDHRLNDFGEFESEEWIKKKDHLKLAQEKSSGKMKIICVYTGLFLEDSIGPWFGLDVAARRFTSIGSPSNVIAFTGKDDIGRALAQLAILAMSRTAQSTVPDHVRIGGTQKSFINIKKIFDAFGNDGEKEIEIKEVNLQEFREEVRKGFLAGDKDPSKHLRVLFGENKLDFLQDCHNELVNPGERVWKWKTMEDYADETGGKGWTASD